MKMNNKEPFDIAPLFIAFLKLQPKECLDEMEELLSIHDDKPAIHSAIQLIKKEKINRI